MKRLLVIFGVVCSSFLGVEAKDQPIKVSTITDTSDPTSTEVTNSFQRKLGTHQNLFEIVKPADTSLLIAINCMPRANTTDLYVCFYMTHYAGGTSKTLMGGGIYLAKTADEMADNFLSAVAQDIAERWNQTMRDNAIEKLESCLFLTQSSCAVPDPLASELKTKTLNLSQYLQKGGLKK